MSKPRLPSWLIDLMVSVDVKQPLRKLCALLLNRARDRSLAKAVLLHILNRNVNMVLNVHRNHEAY